MASCREPADGGLFGPAHSVVRSPNKSTAQNAKEPELVTQSAARRRSENAASGAPRGEHAARHAPRLARAVWKVALRGAPLPLIVEGEERE
jgi:hypothetical protein